MEKYVQDKIKSVVPLAFSGQVENIQDESQRDAELLEEIREVIIYFYLRLKPNFCQSMRKKTHHFTLVVSYK